MFALFKLIPTKELFWIQLPAVMMALLITELLYKFHSFTLECGAFLATWLVIDAFLTALRRVFAADLR